jgi:hypothetical protein
MQTQMQSVIDCKLQRNVKQVHVGLNENLIRFYQTAVFVSILSALQ